MSSFVAHARADRRGYNALPRSYIGLQASTLDEMTWQAPRPSGHLHSSPGTIASGTRSVSARRNKSSVDYDAAWVPLAIGMPGDTVWRQGLCCGCTSAFCEGRELRDPRGLLEAYTTCYVTAGCCICFPFHHKHAHHPRDDIFQLCGVCLEG